MGKKKKKTKKFDILSHSYNPDFRVLNEEEVMKVLEDLDIGIHQLPKMIDKDPVVKILKAEVNDVVEITRESPTAGKTKFYRVVVVSE